MGILKTVVDLGAKEIDYYLNRPNFATLELTFRCNLTCKTCGVWKDSNSKEYIKNEISFDETKKVFSDLKSMGIKKISLLGGETLIRKDIIDIFRLAKEFGFFLVITTNATMISEKNADDIVKSGVDVINYSLDAAYDEHDSIRGIKGTFNKAKRGIEFVRDAKKRLASSTPYTYITTTVSKLNYDKFDKLAPLSKEVGAESMALGYISETRQEDVSNTTFDGKVVSTDYFLPNEGETLLLDDKEISVLREKINKLESGNCKDFIYAGSINALTDKALKSGCYSIKKCYATRERIIIDPVGNVIPCANLRDMSYGNIKEKSIKDIWDGELKGRFIKRLEGKLFPVCPNCCHSGMNVTFTQSMKRIVSEKLRKLF